LDEYLRRATPDEKLPKVIFSKRNGTYWVGQRRCDAFDQNGVLLVQPSSEPFSEWISKVERVEGLKKKGMASAGVMLTYAQ